MSQTGRYEPAIDKLTKSTYSGRTREKISNPYSDIPHEELLKKAGIKKFQGEIEVIDLGNGQIRVQEKQPN